MDQYGKQLGTLTVYDGILNIKSMEMVVDRSQRLLWFGHANRYFEIEPYLPYSFYDKRLGWRVPFLNIIKYKGEL